jgi:integrase
MAVRSRGGRFTVEFEQQGVRVFRRLPLATTRAQAVAYEAKLRQEIFDQRALDRKPDLSLEACVDLWLRDRLSGKKDQRMPRQNAEHLRPFLQGRSVREVQEVVRHASSTWTAAHRASSTSTGVVHARTLTAATVNRRLSVLKAALRYAWQQGWVADNLSGKISKLAEPPGREVYLTPAQVKRLADHMPTPEGRAAVLLLAYTGLRAGELLRITATDIGPGSLTVNFSKSGKPRTIPVPPSILPLLSGLPLGLSYTQLQWQFRAARKAAKMPHVRLHDLRHTTASWLVNAGVDLYTVGKILGHLTPTTTARYAHLAQGTLKKAMGRLK